jgi:hypothetical protein
MKEIKGDHTMKPSIVLPGEMYQPVDTKLGWEDAPEGWVGDPKEWPILFSEEPVAQDVLDAFLRKELEPTVPPPGANNCYAYFSTCIDPVGTDWDMQLESALPDVGRRQGKMTWLEYESNFGELWWMLGFNGADSHDEEFPNAARLAALGIVPGQWFVLRLEPWYEGPDYNGECDCGCEWKLVASEPLSDSDRGTMWHSWLETLSDAQKPCVPVLKKPA